MKQLVFYITLLFCAYCACGHVAPTLMVPSTFKRTPPNATLKNTAVAVSTSEKVCVPWGNKAEEGDGKLAETDGGVLMSKPKLIVTFLANTKTVDKLDGLGGSGGGESPFFLDPFQRLLQFFFSSFTHDFSPRFPKEEDSDLNNNGVGVRSEKFEGTADLDWLTKKEDLPGQPLCEHGINGFCRSCHLKTNRVRDTEHFQPKAVSIAHDFPFLRFNISSLTEKSPDLQDLLRVNKSNGSQTISSTTSMKPPSPSTTSKRVEPVKHKRHYFLSISGGTEQRATAPKTLENQRVKREHHEFTSNRQDSLDELSTTTEYLRIHPIESDYMDRDNLDDLDITPMPGDDNSTKENDYNDFYRDGVLPHVADYSHGWTYFFLVTLPVACTLALVIFLLCICLRTRGWCCRLFLTDPGKNLEEQKAKKERGKAKRKADTLA